MNIRQRYRRSGTLNWPYIIGFDSLRTYHLHHTCIRIFSQNGHVANAKLAKEASLYLLTIRNEYQK